VQVGSARGLGKEKIDRGEKMDESGRGKKGEVVKAGW